MHVPNNCRAVQASQPASEVCHACWLGWPLQSLKCMALDSQPCSAERYRITYQARLYLSPAVLDTLAQLLDVLYTCLVQHLVRPARQAL